MPEARQQALRPVLSPDGRAIASIAPGGEILRVNLADNLHERRTTRILLPKGLTDWLSKVEILRWGPSSTSSAAAYEDTVQQQTLSDSLLLSDGDRLVVLDCPRCGSTSQQYEDDTVQARVRSDYSLGTQHGKVTLAEFSFDGDHAIVLFGTNTHANILALSRPHMDQIAYPKFSDSRCFTKSPNGRFLALLVRANGQDLISVSTSTQDSAVQTSSFVVRSADAQGVHWSPEGDPVLAIVDAAAYGTKVLFYTATGQPLNRLHISNLTAEPTLDLGISSFKWLESDIGTLVAATDGHMNVLVRQQHNQKLQTTSLFSFRHPDVIDGPIAHVFQESIDTNGINHWSRFDTVLAPGVPESTAGNVDILAISRDGSLLCTKVSTHPKVVWMWPKDASESPTILIFCDNLRHALISSRVGDRLVVMTAQLAKAGSEQSYRLYACHTGMAPFEVQVPLSQLPLGFQSGKVEGHYMASKTELAQRNQNNDEDNMPEPLLLTWPGHFEAGLIEEYEDGRLRWRNLTETPAPTHSPHLMQTDGDGSLLFDTPSKPPRHMKATY